LYESFVCFFSEFLALEIICLEEFFSKSSSSRSSFSISKYSVYAWKLSSTCAFPLKTNNFFAILSTKYLSCDTKMSAP